MHGLLDPYFKDLNKDGKLNGAEILEALKDPKTGAKLKEALSDFKDYAKDFNASLKHYKQTHPGEPESNIYKDKHYLDAVAKTAKTWNTLLKDQIDSVTFPNGADVQPGEVLPILQQFGAKVPARPKAKSASL